jgi:hypothetical protein
MVTPWLKTTGQTMGRRIKPVKDFEPGTLWEGATAGCRQIGLNEPRAGWDSGGVTRKASQFLLFFVVVIGTARWTLGFRRNEHEDETEE